MDVIRRRREEPDSIELQILCFIIGAIENEMGLFPCGCSMRDDRLSLECSVLISLKMIPSLPRRLGTNR
jgi:hypothetical protein